MTYEELVAAIEHSAPYDLKEILLALAAAAYGKTQEAPADEEE